MHTNDHIQHVTGNDVQLMNGIMSSIILILPFALLLVTYLFAVIISHRRHQCWPAHRAIVWIVGIFCAVMSLIGPLADRANVDFRAHMLGHLLLGMLAPLLMVLAAPVTLMLRTLSVTCARRVSRMFRSKLIGMISNPMMASFLNIGGLWLLYTTDLYTTMHHSIFLHAIVHMHVFVAGYLFTASFIYIDPTPHRTRFIYRAIILIMALAGHSILAKYIYAHPPIGVALNEAETGSMLMYYGGDIVDLALILIFCLQWFRAARPRGMIAITQK